jgi:hypothetical protein
LSMRQSVKNKSQLEINTMATQIDEFYRDCAMMAGAAYISTRPKINQLPVPNQ